MEGEVRQHATYPTLGLFLIIIGGLGMLISFVLFIAIGGPAMHWVVSLGLGGFFVALIGGICLP